MAVQSTTLNPERGRELAGAEVRPRRSLWGLCADLGPAPSAEEIDEARREAWEGFRCALPLGS
jgi:hypothetical protein